MAGSMFCYLLLVCAGLAATSPVQPGYLRRWGEEAGLVRMRRQGGPPRQFRRVPGPAGPRPRPGQGQERRREPLTQNRQLRPAQPVQVERRRLQDYQPQTEPDTYQTFRQPQREQENFQGYREPQRENFQGYREPEREQENFQGYSEPQRQNLQAYKKPQREPENFQDYREPQREPESFQGYKESQRRVAAPVLKPSKVYERNAVVDSDISESGPVPAHQRDIEAAVHAGAAAYKGVSVKRPE